MEYRPLYLRGRGCEDLGSLRSSEDTNAPSEQQHEYADHD